MSKILMASSECVPFSKTGGLADVVPALSQALVDLGHMVTVFLPRYRQTRLDNPRTLISDIAIPFEESNQLCSVLDGGMSSGVQFYFIEAPLFFDRDGLYGTPAGDYADNAERFALYSRAVLEASKIIGVPDVFHCHDWQSALVPVLLRTIYGDDPVFRSARTVFTIHNIGYQGLFPPDTLRLLMLPRNLLAIDKMEFWGKVNFLKGALVFSDFITTVSRKYSQEIQTAEYGFGLDGVLRARSSSLTGILNGVDYTEWSPEKDRLIVRQYSAEHLEGKRTCKYDLLRQFGMGEASNSLPVVAIISRFAAQKGFDLIAEVVDDLSRLPLMITALGTGDTQYQELFMKLSQQLPDKFAVKIAYDNALAHKIQAGADMFLMPSRYEPCGINQMYSLKYGTVPIVRVTGGLDDTIDEFDLQTLEGTGFKFVEYSGRALLDALRKALQVYKDQDAWQALMRNGMSQDHSYTRTAREYTEIYARVLQQDSSNEQRKWQ